MKAYNVLGLLYATQAEARKAASEGGVSFDTVELPFSATPKDEALEYINRCIRAVKSQRPVEATTTSSQPDPTLKPAQTWAQQREANIQHQIDIAEEINTACYEEARKFQAMAIERMVECLSEMRN